MKKIILILSFMIFPFLVQCQPDKIFKEQITVVSIKFGDGSVQTTALPGIASVTWTDVQNKPLTFPPATHNHDLLYKPITYVPTWTEILNKPPEEKLETAIPQLMGIKLPVMTATQISALTPVKGLLLFNDTEGVLQIYNGTVWKTIITNQ